MEEPVYDQVKAARTEVLAKTNPCYSVPRPSSPTYQSPRQKETSLSTWCQSTPQKSSVHQFASQTVNGNRCVVVLVLLLVAKVCLSVCLSVWSLTELRKFKSMQVTQQNTSQHHAVTQEEVEANITEFMGYLQLALNSVTEMQANTSSDVAMIRELLLYGRFPSQPAVSCLHILQTVSAAPSGYYWIRVSNGSAVQMYCDMTRACGGDTGGWTRVAHMDFSAEHVSCPRGLRELHEADIRTCEIDSTSATCVSVVLNAWNITYSRVCGRVLGYQVGSTDAFGNYGRGNDITIDSNYVDGVSLTHGHSPRKHIWTFAAAIDEFREEPACECSHSQRPGNTPPEFIEGNYFCDSGIQGMYTSGSGLISSSPLWDGAGCGPNSTCCAFNNPPWFNRQLPESTTDDIEMRLCKDENHDGDRYDENVALSAVEIYIQ